MQLRSDYTESHMEAHTAREGPYDVIKPSLLYFIVSWHSHYSAVEGCIAPRNSAGTKSLELGGRLRLCCKLADLDRMLLKCQKVCDGCFGVIQPCAFPRHWSAPLRSVVDLG
jgi:hypothetical protein